MICTSTLSPDQNSKSIGQYHEVIDRRTFGYLLWTSLPASRCLAVNCNSYFEVPAINLPSFYFPVPFYLIDLRRHLLLFVAATVVVAKSKYVFGDRNNGAFSTEVQRENKPVESPSSQKWDNSGSRRPQLRGF